MCPHIQIAVSVHAAAGTLVAAALSGCSTLIDVHGSMLECVSMAGERYIVPARAAHSFATAMKLNAVSATVFFAAHATCCRSRPSRTSRWTPPSIAAAFNSTILADGVASSSTADITAIVLLQLKEVGDGAA